MAFSFRFGGKTWWVARSISGYVTRAHEGEGEIVKILADNDAKDIDDLVFQQKSVSEHLISSAHKVEHIPKPWRIISILSKQNGRAVFYLVENRKNGLHWNIFGTPVDCEEYIQDQGELGYGQSFAS